MRAVDNNDENSEDEPMNKPIGPDLYRCSTCNDLTGMRDGPCGRCAMSSPAPQPTTITKCALCDVAFTARPDGFVDEAIEREAAAHHAVCPARPIEVGDRVRVLETTTNRLHGALGQIVEICDANDGMPYRVKVDGDDWVGWWCYKVERIPRPAEAQAMVPRYVRWWPNDRGDASRYSDGWLDGVHLTIEHHGPRWSSADGMIGDRVHIQARGEIATIDRPAEALATRTVTPCGCIVHGGTCAHEAMATMAPPLAPVLVDGLTDYGCDERWCRNRSNVENGLAPEFALTEAQIAVGRAAWQQRNAPKLGSLLRAKVAASAEAERCRVTYCEVDPWE